TLDVIETIPASLVSATTAAPAGFLPPAVSQAAGGTLYVWSRTGLAMPPGAAWTFTVTGFAGVLSAPQTAVVRAVVVATAGCAASLALTNTATVTMVPPPVPTCSLTLSAVLGGGAATLSWTATSTDAITGFEVWRGAGSAAGAGTAGKALLATLGPGTLTWSDAGLPSSGTFCYEVVLLTGASCSAYAEACVTTSCSVRLAAVPLPSSVVLTWTSAATGAEVSAFEVWRGASGGVPGTAGKTLLGTLGATAVTYTDHGLLAGTDYCYAVVVRAAPGCTAFAEACVATGAFAAYPNPASLAQGPVHFDGLAAGEAVEVYTINGELVRRHAADADGLWDWDGRNESGSLVAPGLYLYLVRGKTATRKGTLVIRK
ncbi:MAG: hypothetical protein AAB368_04585, partial [bacterium]